MRMMSPDEVPRTKTIGILSGCAASRFVVPTADGALEHAGHAQ